MPLFTLNPIGFIPTVQAEAARTFYEKTLGLTFISDDGFAQVFHMGPSGDLTLRVVRVAPASFHPAPYTILGWETQDIERTTAHMQSNGVVFERFPNLPQDERGIWTAPGGDRIAWFKDPDGNTLSVSQH